VYVTQIYNVTYYTSFELLCKAVWAGHLLGLVIWKLNLQFVHNSFMYAWLCTSSVWSIEIWTPTCGHWAVGLYIMFYYILGTDFVRLSAWGMSSFKGNSIRFALGFLVLTLLTVQGVRVVSGGIRARFCYYRLLPESCIFIVV